ncbi:MAG: 4-alpha-glucanotransferase [Sporichthyaceae bacterium]|nr:4-alpha-glucanotransferase [Sporichthyaceae bacterium]
MSAELTDSVRELAEAFGVATEFWDWQGNHVEVPYDTVVGVLAALGVAADSEEAARAALQEVRDQPWRRTLPPVVVTRSGRPAEVPVHVPHGDAVRVWVELESGGTVTLGQLDRWVEPQETGGVLTGEATFAVPGDLPLGWHTIHAQREDIAVVEQVPLVVTPDRLPPALDGEKSAWGFMTQLYSVRSKRSWAHGDLDDLAELARWSGDRLGAGFVLVNPLHAPSPTTPIEPSPYLPVTRRFVSPLYIRVELVPEHAYLAGAVRTEIERTALLQRSLNAADVLLDRDAVWEAKRSALSVLHSVPRSPARAADYAEFLAREGEGLRNFATWCALAEMHGAVWSTWPEALQDPTSAEVMRHRDELAAERVDFYCWLQWVLDEQLAAAQRRARESGMPLGVVHDLAVGVHPDGADTWALQDVMARGVTVGAPPDAFNQLGQDWSQPPWRPDRLAQAAYLPYRDMLRTVLRHCGGVRVDHIIGLFRLWWVPEGRPASEGTYVRFDHEALIGILALEAWRAGAVVIGEDLGTVEPWVRDYLGERGVLGTSILWFERDEHGRPRPPETWRELCLAAVTTHDLPPTAGYLAGEHIRIRSELGLLTRTVEEEQRVDEADQQSWLALLAERGWLQTDAETDGGEPGEEGTVLALHRALAATPCRLLGVALPDAVGDRRTVNQPGTHDEYPNWRVPLSDPSGRPVLLDDLVDSPRAARLAAAVRTPPDGSRAG